MLIKSKEVDNYKSFRFHSKQAENLLEDSSIDVLVEDEAEKQARLLAELKQQAYEEGLQQGIQEGRQQGVNAGFSQGYKDGLVQGQEEGEKKLQSAADRFDEAVQAFSSLQDSVKDFVRNSSIELVEKISHKVIENELQTSPEIILKWIDKALDALPEQPANVTIFLSPTNLEKVMPIIEENAYQDWQVKPQVSLKNSQIDVRTSLVDIYIDSEDKLKAILKEL